MITKPVPALLSTPTGHYPTSRTTPELATALGVRLPGANATPQASDLTGCQNLARRFGG